MPLNIAAAQYSNTLFEQQPPKTQRKFWDIYNHYVQQTTITFEEQPVAHEDMEQRLAEVLKNLAWLVLEEGGTIEGFAYVSKWKGRCAYRCSVESTVYIRPEAQ